MKKTIFTLVLAVFALAATTAFAQVNVARRADLPMAFSIAGERYAAGPYQLRVTNSAIGQPLNIETGHGGMFMLLSPQQANPARRAPRRYCDLS
jgi:hypothetical protein